MIKLDYVRRNAAVFFPSWHRHDHAYKKQTTNLIYKIT